MNIVFYGGHRWEQGAWFRKQQFANRFAERGHKVYYIEDSISIIRKKNHHTNKYFKTYTKKINENLTVIIPSAFFPFPKNKKIRHLYNVKLLSDIKRILKSDGINDFLLWFNRLEFSTVLPKLNNTIKIVDLCDDIPFYAKLAGDEKSFEVMSFFLQNALSNSNTGIVSAVKIKEKYQHFAKNELIVIPNGHDIKQRETGNLPLPEKLANINKPLIGFLGTLFHFIDHELLEFIISKRPEYNFIFLGGIQKNFPIEKIKNYKNVHLIGKVPKNEVPLYLNAFDVCLNPFVTHEVNDSVNPVKVFEYLAMSKNIVSTKMYSLMKEEIGNYIEFADTYDEFLSKIDHFVKEKNFTNNIPQSVIDAYHWDNLFLKMVTELNNQLNLNL